MERLTSDHRLVHWFVTYPRTWIQGRLQRASQLVRQRMRPLRQALVVGLSFLLILGGPLSTLVIDPPTAHAQSTHVQPTGDKNWKGTSAPKPPSIKWKAPAGHSAPLVKPNPHAKRVKELTGKRTANASFFQMSDGSTQEDLSAIPVHYRDAKGVWQDINPTVGPVSHDGFTSGAVNNSFQTYFSSNSSSLVRLEQGSGFVELGLVGATTPAPVVSGSTVTYHNAYPGTDILYQTGPEGVKESIVLTKAPAAGASFEFTLKVSGLTAKQLPDGAIAFYGSESANPVFVIPAPYMTDSTSDANSPYGKVYSPKVAPSRCRSTPPRGPCA